MLLATLGAACTKSGGGASVANSGGGASTVSHGESPHDRAPTQPEGQVSGHHFTAQVHEPHYPVAVLPPPNPDALPRFVDGSARCFPQPYEDYSYRRSAPSSASGYGSGHGRLGGSHSTKSSAKSAAPPPAPSAPRPLPEKRQGQERARASAKAADSSSSHSEWSSDPLLAPLERSASRPAAESPKKDKAKAGPRYEAEPEGRFDSDEGVAPQRYAAEGFGASIYLSNDDTMSLSSAQRVIWAIDHYRPLPSEHIRPHELLNYFSFDTAPVSSDHDFSIAANIAPKAENPNELELSLAVAGRPVTRETRRNANLAFVVDRSGSMAEEGRMDYLRQGLLRSLSELKNGDIVHITLFDTTACDLAQNFVVGRDSMRTLENLIRRIAPSGSTNLHDGLTRGYSAADRAYQPSYTNRVILVTDALTNTGVTDETLISLVGTHYDSRRIRLSGIGVGSEFNDSLLDNLTERGKGAYVFLGSPLEVDAVFGSRFVSLIETIANDVHFKLELPPSLALATFYGEEASTQKERVQSIHYFAGTSQLFLSDLRTRDGGVPNADDFKLTIEYQEPETGRARVEEFVWNIGEIVGRAPNLDKARLLSTFALRLKEAAERPLPISYREERYGYEDRSGFEFCAQTADDLARRAAPLRGDAEVQRVEGLWSQYCNRYARVALAPPPPVVAPPRPHPQPYVAPAAPRPPVRNNDYAPRSSWPSASR